MDIKRDRYLNRLMAMSMMCSKMGWEMGVLELIDEVRLQKMRNYAIILSVI